MSTKHIKIEEQLTDSKEDALRSPDIVRITVADKAEALVKFDKYKDDFTGTTYTAKLVTVRHSEGLPCLTEDL